MSQAIQTAPLRCPLTNRDSAPLSVDSFLQNGYFEKDPEYGFYIKKRPGLTSTATYPAGVGQGITAYNAALYAVIGDVLRSPGAANSGTSGSTWSLLTTAPWAARSAHTAVVFNNRIWVFGGFTTGSSFSDIWSSDDGVNWQLHSSSAPWGIRQEMGTVVMDGKLYVMGGLRAGAVYNDVWVSENGTDWTQLTPAAPWTARSGFGCVSANNGIYVIGGYNGITTDGQVWFSANGADWTQTTSNLPGRSRFGCLVLNNVIYVIGGSPAGTSASTSNTVFSSTDGGYTWNTLTTAAFVSARQRMACCVYANKLWAIGGATSAPANLTDVYSSSDGVTWTQNYSSGFSGGFNLAAAVSFSTPITTSTFRYPSIWILGGDFGAGQSQSVYLSSLNTATATSYVIPTATAQQNYYFDKLLNANYFLIKNQTELFYLYAGTLSRVTDKSYPARTVAGIAVLDSFVFVMDSDGGIHSCKLADATVWNSLDYIRASYQQDRGMFIGTHLNYIVAWKEFSMQFFYNAGNPRGSPLALDQGANVRLGMASANSAVYMENTYVWMGRTELGGRGIYFLDGRSPTKVSTEPVDRIINASSLAAVYALGYKTQGHVFYILTLADLNISLIYDFATKEWALINSLVGALELYFQWVASAVNPSTGRTCLLNATSGELADVNPGVFQDIASNIVVKLCTEKMNMGNNFKKLLPRLEIIGDKTNTSVAVRFTDDDYVTFSASRNVTLNLKRPALLRCGSFYERAFELTHQANTNLRLRALQLHLEGDMLPDG